MSDNGRSAPSTADPSENKPNQREKSAGPKNDHFYKAWDSFLAQRPQRANTTSELAIKANEVRKAAEKDGDGLNIHEPVLVSYDEAVERCKAKVEAIRQECHRLNQKYRDQLFDMDDSNTIEDLDGTPVESMVGTSGEDRHLPVKRVSDIFTDPQFFVDGATADDVVQGAGGDCWFLAALMSISAMPELITRLCVARDEKCGVYGFVFFRDGEWLYEVIDDRLFLKVGDHDDLLIIKAFGGSTLGDQHDLEKLRDSLQKGGTALYFASCKGHETWLPLIEKAYAKAHGDYKVIEGGWVSEGIEDLTGGVAVTVAPDDIMDRDLFWKDLLDVNKTFLFGGSTSDKDRHGIVSSHAYTVLQAWEEGPLRLLKIKNPWAKEEWNQAWSDGNENWTPEMMQKLNHKFGNDGVFWMSYEDFLKHFPAIYRCKLFGPEWTITQHWTSVNVPWMPCYLDTKFEVTVTEKGPVVFVLCQPDTRYFRGLTGRYSFALHFRVYNKADPDKYLVRSMLTSGGDTEYNRSVSAEIDLEPGTYNVLLKVTAIRDEDAETAEEVIKDKHGTNKEKLHTVGRNFEIATTKGLLREKEFANRQAARDDEKKKTRAGLVKGSIRDRSLKRLESAQTKKRDQRLKDAKAARKQEREQAKRLEEQKKAVKASRNASRSHGRKREEKRKRHNKHGRKNRRDTQDDSQQAEQDGEPEVANGVASPPEEDKAETHPQRNKTMHNLLRKILRKGEPTPQDLDKLRSLLGDLKLQDGVSDGEAGNEEEEEEEAAAAENGADGEEAEERDDSEDTDSSIDEDDFDWDEEIDGPVFLSDDEEPEEEKIVDLHADDPWNAICVLGLRVYSMCKNLTIETIEGGN